MADGVMGYPGGLERRDYAAGAVPVLPTALRRISWGAVFAGLIVSIMVSLVLALLGMSIGLGTVNPLEENNPFSGLGMGAGIWWVVSSLIALFLGGWVAARMAGIPRRFDGALHGVLTWGLVTLLTFYLLSTTIGRLVGGVSSMVGKGLSAAGQGAAAMAPQAANAVQDQLKEQGVTMDRIKQEGEQLMRQSGQPALTPEAMRNQAQSQAQGAQGAAATAMQDPKQASEELNKVMERIKNSAGGTASQADRDAAVNIITSRTGKSPEEANQIVSRWETTMKESSQKIDAAKAQAEQKAREYGQTAAAGMSKASLWTFIALLLGGIAAALGGRTGIPKEISTPTNP
jgi:hypothetical protein